MPHATGIYHDGLILERDMQATVARTQQQADRDSHTWDRGITPPTKAAHESTPQQQQHKQHPSRGRDHTTKRSQPKSWCQGLMRFQHAPTPTMPTTVRAATKDEQSAHSPHTPTDLQTLIGSLVRHSQGCTTALVRNSLAWPLHTKRCVGLLA